MDSPKWLTRFSDAALQADQYWKGRFLLAGDAAHVHFPAGGQGLNTGLQDAVNLGWKLAAVINGWSPAGLLDTYHTERHPVGAEVLYNVRAQVALMNPTPSVDALRQLFSKLMTMDQVNAYLAGMVSGTGIVYEVGRPDDPIAGRFVHEMLLKTADATLRLARLLHSGRPVLLDLADRSELRDAARRWSSRVDTVTAVPEGELDTDAVLVRPDGYAVWSARGDSEDPDTLKAALMRWFGTAE